VEKPSSARPIAIKRIECIFRLTGYPRRRWPIGGRRLEESSARTSICGRRARSPADCHSRDQSASLRVRRPPYRAAVPEHPGSARTSVLRVDRRPSGFGPRGDRARWLRGAVRSVHGKSLARGPVQLAGAIPLQRFLDRDRTGGLRRTAVYRVAVRVSGAPDPLAEESVSAPGRETPSPVIPISPPVARPTLGLVSTGIAWHRGCGRSPGVDHRPAAARRARRRCALPWARHRRSSQRPGLATDVVCSR
jgi:hypothetical protein